MGAGDQHLLRKRNTAVRRYGRVDTTKGALNNYTKMLSNLYGEHGVLVNTGSPACIKTPLVESMLDEQATAAGISTAEAEAQFLSENRPGIVLRRSGTIEETAAVVVWLASDRASFVTGSNYRVDGGTVMSL